jgi:cell wall-associated NlpC family hydrolase
MRESSLLAALDHFVPDSAGGTGLALPAEPNPMTSLTSCTPRRSMRLFAVMAMVASSATTADAQGPTVPADPRPASAESKPVDAATRLAASVAGFTSAAASRVSAERPKPFAAWSVSAQAFRDSILVSVARTAVGTRYVRGGQSFDGGFDCSGLVRYVMTALDVAVPRTAAEQGATGLAVGRDTTRLRPGDLLTFGKGPRDVSHVGIYIGHGRFVHASSAAGQVIESDIGRTSSPLIKIWRGARRLLSSADVEAEASTTGGS